MKKFTATLSAFFSCEDFPHYFIYYYMVGMAIIQYYSNYQQLRSNIQWKSIRITIAYPQYGKSSLSRCKEDSKLTLLDFICNPIPTPICSRTFHSSISNQQCFDRKYVLAANQAKIRVLCGHKCRCRHCKLILTENHHWWEDGCCRYILLFMNLDSFQFGFPCHTF